ncbi:cyanophycinase [Flavobacterium sp. xlx-214]|uniref:cyanophycinase n=1 Tax=unclassified Flavobacterium TaxID=196869 RepID=UPI0013D5CD03|nr:MULTISPECIES: cyanophycinase [unclassified Flavobacterium]MBA5793448.1 cyanophycinase [Flavobacterium sp. xlx-221]QMI82780.1 cyanophycinase [Flavobacterium sp. xlx-214]
MSIKGKLIIVGGAINIRENAISPSGMKSTSQDFFFENGILKRIVEASKLGQQSRIEIITTASQMPTEAAETYINAFSLLGAKNVSHLPIENRKDAIDSDHIKRLQSADVVLFTGGDQLRLTSTLGGTLFHQTLLQKYYHEEFIYAGTSAGAAAASSSMIYEGESSNALLKGSVEINSGLGLIDSIIVDTHFMHRGRIGRLFQAVVGNPMKIGIGLGEDTGLLIENNNKMTAIGSGNVILVDGREILDTSLTQVAIGQPISISHLISHVMTRNDIFYLDENKIVIKDSQYKQKNETS